MNVYKSKDRKLELAARLQKGRDKYFVVSGARHHPARVLADP